MCQNSDMKDRIVLGKHQLDCGDDQHAAVYRDDRSGRYDGVHMYGRLGRKEFTKSVTQLINSVHPPLPTTKPAHKQHFRTIRR